MVVEECAAISYATSIAINIFMQEMNKSVATAIIMCETVNNVGQTTEFQLHQQTKHCIFIFVGDKYLQSLNIEPDGIHWSVLEQFV